MFNLIKNEIIKIFKKKSTIIFILIMFLYSGLITYMYTKDLYQVQVEEFYVEIDDNFDLRITELDKKSVNYYNDLTKILIEKKKSELSKLYKEPWHLELINDEYHNTLLDYYINKYGINNKKLNKKLEQDLDYLENIMENNLIQDYLNYKINILEDSIKNDNNMKDNELEIIKQELSIYNYRIKNNVYYDSSYLDLALTDQLNNYKQLFYYNSLSKLSEEDKTHSKYIEAEIIKNDYILENKVDLNNHQSLRGLLIDFGENYILFFFLFVIMIAGTIFSTEFSKGTIKNLLITPYLRVKILLAKFITMILSLPFIIIILLIFNILLGGIIFGFSTINIPILEFNYTTSLLVQYNIFKYIGLVLLGVVPQFLLLMMLSFLLSIIYPSASLAISIPFAGLIASSIINHLAIMYNVRILRYFVTLNWDFQQYIFGKNPFEEYFKHTSLNFSLIICFVYFLVMFILSIIIFKKRDIKNN